LRKIPKIKIYCPELFSGFFVSFGLTRTRIMVCILDIFFKNQLYKTLLLKLFMHDTHVHLEMLLTKLELFEDSRFFDSTRSDNLPIELSTEAKNKLEELLANHDFALQSTVSTDNYLLVSQLFEFLPKVKFFLGSHPDIVKSDFNLTQYLNYQKPFLDLVKDKIVGLGEIGLDYFHSQDKQVHHIQQELFASQIRLALDYDLPIMIHCREAFEDTFKVLDRFPQIYDRFLIHCFTGSRDDLSKVLSRGGKVAFGGVCTFKSAVELQEALRICPLDSFVLETDLPFLAPVPHRGQVCLPKMVQEVAKHIGLLKNLTLEQVWQFSLSNTQSLFRL
jgi:TatD family hydrolase